MPNLKELTDSVIDEESFPRFEENQHSRYIKGRKEN